LGAIELDRLSHAGEWETSMILAVHPELVHPERGEPGYTGDPGPAIAAMFADGVDAVAPNGVVGDSTRASTEHGARYWDEVLKITLQEVS
jgi:creatinine amidohydrolase/Fe(II)-dependent formamide hydrolase-like protein